MNNDERIIELLADMLHEQRGIREDFNKMLEELRSMKIEQQITNQRLDRLEKQQAKTNLAIGELRLSVLKLADKFETVAQHDQRIFRLEEAVFHA